MSGGSCYDALSPVYDRFNGDVDYTAIADAVTALFGKYSKREVRSVLDLGCGSGPLTAQLAERGYEVTGLDISEDMLAFAAARSECAERGVLFVRGDMRKFSLPVPVDAVVSTQDSVSHLTTSGALSNCFSCVSDALAPGGVFIFDVNTAYRMKEEYGDSVFVLEDGDSYTVWENEYLPRGPGVEFRVTVFRKKGDLWEREDGCSRERGWSVRSIEDALRKAGLDPVLCASAWDMAEICGETGRIAFVALKK